MEFSNRFILMIFLVFTMLLKSLCLPVSALGKKNVMIQPDSIPCKAAVIPDDRFQNVRAKIINMVVTGEIPSMSIAVAKDGKVIWEEAIGWADKKNDIGATPETIYPLASMSKSIMATGIMTLVEKGEIKLDDPVEKYIHPGVLRVYEGETSDLKIKHLLGMTGGIVHGSLSYWEPYSPIPEDEFVSRYVLSVFPPGKVYHYSNFSAGLSEPIVTQVTGKDLASFMHEEVFTPLGMNRTFVKYPSETENVAVKYNTNGSRLYHVYFAPLGGGGFYSCVGDLIQYGMFFLKNDISGQKKILTDGTIDLMHTVQDTTVPGAVVGLGWASIEVDRDLFWVLSNGEISGASSNLTLIPSENIAVVCLTNTHTKSADQTSIEIADLLLPGFAKKVGAKIEKYESQRRPKTYQSQQHFLGSWEGEIRTHNQRIPVKMLFQEDGDIHIQLDDQLETLLSGASVSENILTGSFLGSIPNDLEFEHPHSVELHLRNQDNRLYGFVRSYFIMWDKGVFSLPYYIHLERGKGNIQ